MIRRIYEQGRRFLKPSFYSFFIHYLFILHLKNKFDLVCTVQKIGIPNKYSLYIIGSSVPALRTLVLPYMPSCMHYKLGL